MHHCMLWSTYIFVHRKHLVDFILIEGFLFVLVVHIS